MKKLKASACGKRLFCLADQAPDLACHYLAGVRGWKKKENQTWPSALRGEATTYFNYLRLVAEVRGNA